MEMHRGYISHSYYYFHTDLLSSIHHTPEPLPLYQGDSIKGFSVAGCHSILGKGIEVLLSRAIKLCQVTRYIGCKTCKQLLSGSRYSPSNAVRSTAVSPLQNFKPFLCYSRSILNYSILSLQSTLLSILVSAVS